MGSSNSRLISYDDALEVRLCLCLSLSLALSRSISTPLLLPVKLHCLLLPPRDCTEELCVTPPSLSL